MPAVSCKHLGLLGPLNCHGDLGVASLRENVSPPLLTGLRLPGDLTAVRTKPLSGPEEADMNPGSAITRTISKVRHFADRSIVDVSFSQLQRNTRNVRPSSGLVMLTMSTAIARQWRQVTTSVG